MRDKVLSDGSQFWPMGFTWKSEWGGTTVLLTGEFNNWSQSVKLIRNRAKGDNDFHCVILLAEGTFMIKYIVDDQWRLAPNQQTMFDNDGHCNNRIVVNKETSLKTISDLKAEVLKPRLHERGQVSSVLRYVEREFSDCVETNFRPFEVMLDPTPEEDDELTTDVDRVSSFHLLVDMIAANNPTLPRCFELVKGRVEAALNEQIRTLLAQANQRLKRPNSVVIFNSDDMHPSLRLDPLHTSVKKSVAGNYGHENYVSARIAQLLRPNRTTYFEILFRTQSDSGGICVGFSTRCHSLSSLVGTQRDGIGLYSNGDLICNNNREPNYSKPFHEGSVVGVLATLRESSSGPRRLECSFAIDGDFFAVTRPLEFPRGWEVFPTVTLFTPNTEVAVLGMPAEMRFAHTAIALHKDKMLFTLDAHPLTNNVLRRAQNTVFEQ
eukprot:c2099_g1_i1.p1 GENE.c2099_g1_i1~~c2099_g1_i1.p1  ORF type:complete len:436 (-),score=64.48 c2099_g1_i1:50-1357(-)